MKHSEFKVGDEFFTAIGRWRCTDIGGRTITAIKLDKGDKSWHSGPPYAVSESSFNEYDFGGCAATYAEAVRRFGDSFVENELKRS